MGFSLAFKGLRCVLQEEVNSVPCYEGVSQTIRREAAVLANGSLWVRAIY